VNAKAKAETAAVTEAGMYRQTRYLSRWQHTLLQQKYYCFSWVRSKNGIFLLLLEIVMKKLAIASLLVLSGAAFATGPVPASGGPAHVVINGNSAQVALFDSSSVSNTATNNDTKASQNVSSNSGNVTVNGNQLQLTALQSALLSNKATNGDAVATQNVSSNLGMVDINGNSLQITAARFSAITNAAVNSKSKAVQNIASNNGCETCKPGSSSGSSHD
jgi:hypothetical protein